MMAAVVAMIGDDVWGQEAALKIVDNGRSSYQVVVGVDAFPTTRLAAEELVTYLKRATGVELPIVAKPAEGGDYIFISHTDQLAPHGFVIQTKGRHVFLRGHDSDGVKPTVDFLDPVLRGTCHAVYEFLERFVGVRWYWNDGLGEMVPTRDRIAIPSSIGIKQEPRFDYRALVYGPADTQHGDWARRNRLGSAFTMHHGHALHNIVPVEEWAKRGHPDYAALRGGRRRIEGARGGSGGHVCTSHPDVVALVAGAANDFFAAHPKRTMFSISPPDGSGTCMDERCRLLDVPDYVVPQGPRRGKVVKTDRILWFYNEVAKRVYERYPDRMLGGIIYADYLYPPRRAVEVHPMLALIVTPNTALDWWNEDTREFSRALYEDWGRILPRAYAYDTPSLSRRSFGLPAPLGDRLTELVRVLEAANYHGAYLYIGPTWECLGPDAYVLARLLWDPNVDVDRIRREYYSDLYGPAGAAVRQYFEAAEQCWKRVSQCDEREVERVAESLDEVIAWAREGVARLLIGYEPGLAELEMHVTAAEEAAGAEGLPSDRVARIRDSLTLTSATIRGLRAVVDYESDAGKDVERLKPLGRSIAERERLLSRVGRSYGAELAKRMEFADRSVRFPLQVGGHYDLMLKKTAP